MFLPFNDINVSCSLTIAKGDTVIQLLAKIKLEHFSYLFDVSYLFLIISYVDSFNSEDFGRFFSHVFLMCSLYLQLALEICVPSFGAIEAEITLAAEAGGRWDCSDVIFITCCSKTDSTSDGSMMSSAYCSNTLRFVSSFPLQKSPGDSLILLVWSSGSTYDDMPILPTVPSHEGKLRTTSSLTLSITNVGLDGFPLIFSS